MSSSSAQSSPVDTLPSSSEPVSAIALAGPSLSNINTAPITIEYNEALSANVHGLSTSAASSGGFTMVTSRSSSSMVDVDADLAEDEMSAHGIRIRTRDTSDIDLDLHNGATTNASHDAPSPIPPFIVHLKSGLSVTAASNGSNGAESSDENGHMFFHENGTSNGFSSNGKNKAPPSEPSPSSLSFHASYLRAVTRVNPPGDMMYLDSSIQREEYVRLVLQSLRDIGYHQAAAVLEVESGYVHESDLIASFRESVLEGRWDAVEGVLESVGIRGDDNLKAAHFLVRQEKYLECLEAKRADQALQILRNELAPLNFDSDRLHLLSSLMMCASLEELTRRAGWNGTAAGSRVDLLNELQSMIPATAMLPPRRMEALLLQSQEAQRRACLFHNSRQPFSLYVNHDCGRALFPSVTTNVLAEHDNEVWNVEWSRDGKYIASGGKDRNVIIWSVGPPAGREGRMCHMERMLKTHDEISALAWSPDSTQLLASSEGVVRLWNVKAGVCVKQIKDHGTLVTAVRWLPDGSGFVTAAFDTNIFFYDAAGNRDESRTRRRTNLRVVDFEISPNGKYLIAVGQPAEVIPNAAQQTLAQQQTQQQTQQLQSSASSTSTGSSGGNGSVLGAVVPPFDLPLGAYSVQTELSAKRTQMIMFDLEGGTKRLSQIRVGDMTSIKISRDSRYALINYAPNVLFLWDIEGFRLIRRYMGHLHESTVLRSCFGGADETWIVTGDEDRTIRVWHRDTGDELEILEGHKTGGVNTVSWNPVDDSVFASCSDDGTVRIWEAPSWALGTMHPYQLSGHSPALNQSPKSFTSSFIPPSDLYMGGGIGAGSASSSRSFLG